jgi:hypothetical protein
MSARPLLARLVLFLALAAPALASEHIKLKSGKILRGRATAYDAQTKVLSFRTDDGQEAQYPLDQLDQRSVYLVNAGLIPKDNGRGQLQLANFARDAGLYAHARRHYGYAAKADPALEAEVDRELALGRKLAADFCLKNAQEALTRSDIKGVEKWATTLIEKLPDEPQADQAAALLEQHYLAERNARDDQAEREHDELLQKDLKQGKERYDRMLARTKDGLTAKNSSKSKGLWEGAIDDGEFVLRELDRLEKKYADDQRVQEGVAKYRKLTIDQMVDLHLHLASHYTIKSSYKDALKETNRALALDPRNSQALSQRARIEQASSEGLGLDWF